MKNTQYVVVQSTNIDKIVALVNEQIAEATSVRMCGAPFVWTAKDGTATWYQGMIVVRE